MMANDCGSCKSWILKDQEVIKCSSCGQTFHLGCSPIGTADNISKLGANVEKWECPKCASAATSEEYVDEVVTRAALEDVVGELRVTTSRRNDEVVRELEELRGSVETLSRQVEEFKRSVSLVEEEIDHLQTENSRLQTRNGNLWRTVVRLGDDLNDLQQLRCRDTATVHAAVDNQQADNDLTSPRMFAVLGLSYLTVAGLLYLIIASTFRRAMRIIKSDAK